MFTGQHTDSLEKMGIGPGTRACIDRSKRELIEVGDRLGCYFMDDRAASAFPATARAAECEVADARPETCIWCSPRTKRSAG